MIAAVLRDGKPVEWLAPSSLEEAAELRAQRGADTTVVAGGSFLGILMNQGFVEPASLLSLGRIEELRGIEVRSGELCLGAMVTHRRVERSSRPASRTQERQPLPAASTGRGSSRGANSLDFRGS